MFKLGKASTRKWDVPLLACTVAAGVVLVESVVLMMRFGGGRPSATGYGWLTQMIGHAAGIDFLAGLPAYFARYYELTSPSEILRFLGAATLLNVVLALIIGGPVAAVFLWVSKPGGGRRPAGRKTWTGARLAVWLILMSPVVLHMVSEAVLPEVARTASPVRFAIGGGMVALLWLLMLWPALRWKRFELAPNSGAMLFVPIGFALVLGGAVTELTTVREAGPAGSGPNILLISIDSLRADHVHAYGYERETSPQLDKLASEGVLFRHTVAPTSWTLPSHVTMLTSLPPIQHQVTGDFTRLRPDAVTLAEVLQAQGYATAAFVSGPYLQAEYGHRQGFDLYDDYSAMPRMWNVDQKITSPALFEAVTEWIEDWDRKGRERPFFIFLHMWDVHYDFNAPEPYGKMFDPDYSGPVTGQKFEASGEVHPDMDPRDLQHIVALYDGEIRYTDEHLGELFAFLRERKVFDESVVAVTADHGEEFFEHGAKGHRKTLYDESLLVPLVIRYPEKLSAGEVVSNQVRLLDLAPTLLGLAGIEAPADFGMNLGNPGDFGRDLFGEAPPPPVAYGTLSWFLGSVRTNEWKLVVHVEGEPKPEVYNLANDPAEQVNLANQEGERLDILYQRLMAFRKSGGGRRLAESMEVDQEHMKALRSLGYLTDYVEDALKIDMEMLSPEPGSYLSQPTVTFEWEAVDGIEYYYLKVGSTVDGEDLYGQNEGKSTSATVSGIPIDGRTIHVRLWARLDGELIYEDFAYETGKEHLPCVGTVKLTNLSHGGAVFHVGDRFRVEISGPPEKSLVVKAYHEGQATGAIHGYMDGDGRRVIEGTMLEEQLGRWNQTWLVGGRCLNPQLEFEVLPASGN